MTKKVIIVTFIALLGLALVFKRPSLEVGISNLGSEARKVEENLGGLIDQKHPLTIDYLRNFQFSESDLVIEETLQGGSNYRRFIVSYVSENLKQYALLTIPNGTKPESGWPVIIFNHGYIPPSQYKTTERYIAYVDGFARNGYMVIRPDYRGHGNSEGIARGGYGASDYTIDVLYAVSSIKKHPDADPNRIGMWGHSMGGHITLRSMVATKDIKAGVIWAGVVASYPDLVSRWRRTPSPQATPISGQRRWRTELIEQYGDPSTNPSFWNSISATSYLTEISGPIQLHHGTADSSVPVAFSQRLEQQMKEAGKSVEYFEYQGDDHNLSKSFSSAMSRSIAFFDKYLKN